MERKGSCDFRELKVKKKFKNFGDYKNVFCPSPKYKYDMYVPYVLEYPYSYLYEQVPFIAFVHAGV